MTKPEVLTGSNLSNDYKDSQIIEPIINTITDAMKYTFYDYNDPNVYSNPSYRQRFLWRDFLKEASLTTKLRCNDFGEKEIITLTPFLI